MPGALLRFLLMKLLADISEEGTGPALLCRHCKADRTCRFEFERSERCASLDN